MTFEEKRKVINEIIDTYAHSEEHAYSRECKELLVQALQADALYTLCDLLQREDISQAVKDAGSKIADALVKSK